MGWVAEWGPKLGEAGAGIPMEMLSPLQTDSVTLTERPLSPDPGRGSGRVVEKWLGWEATDQNASRVPPRGASSLKGETW